MRSLLLLCLSVALAAAAPAGDAGPIPTSEMTALDRAISRELNSSQHGSQTLADLRRLKQRLLRLQAADQAPSLRAPAWTEAEREKEEALKPLYVEDGDAQQLDRLLDAAEGGSRASLRSLALYYLYMNEPEKALMQWRRMGRATNADLPYLLISSYLEIALGEYNAGRNDIEEALRLMDSRASLALSTPVFCLNVGGYRIYTPRPAGDLLPGDDVLIYVEIEGADFHAQDGGRECRLMFGLRLKNESGYTMWSEANYGEYAPFFAGPVRDLHAALSWRVPNDLRSGHYELFVEAVETDSKRRGESVIAFNVGRRETNPEKRVTAAAPGDARAIDQANRAFYGSGIGDAGNSSTRTLDSVQEFDRERYNMEKQFYQMGRPDR